MQTLAIVLVVLVLAWLVGRRGGAGAVSGGVRPRTSARKRCAWEPTGTGSGRLKEFRCRTCGVVAYSAETGGPTLCKKDLDGA